MAGASLVTMVTTPKDPTSALLLSMIKTGTELFLFPPKLPAKANIRLETR